jgi:hypothetical protein
MNNLPNDYWLDNAFMAALEERAAFFEVTVDYYLEEFFCSDLDEHMSHVLD